MAGKQDNLDKRLREILDVVWGAALDYSTSPDLRNQQGVLNEVKYLKAKKNTKSYGIAQIREAFKEEGYVRADFAKDVKTYINAVTDKAKADTERARLLERGTGNREYNDS